MLLPSQTITKSTENSTTYSTSNRVMAWQHKSFSFPTASQNDVWRSSTCTFPLFRWSGCRQSQQTRRCRVVETGESSRCKRFCSFFQRTGWWWRRRQRTGDWLVATTLIFFGSWRNRNPRGSSSVATARRRPKLTNKSNVKIDRTLIVCLQERRSLSLCLPMSIAYIQDLISDISEKLHVANLWARCFVWVNWTIFYLRFIFVWFGSLATLSTDLQVAL